MKVLGVDPGLRVSGYAVLGRSGRGMAVQDAGVISAATTRSLAERLAQLYGEIDELLKEHEPDMMAVEELYSHYHHPKTAILMGHARGMFLLAAGRRQIPVYGFSATRVKKSVTGNGRASKQQVQRAAMSQLKLAKLPRPVDVSDALAVAICCFNEHDREVLGS